MSIIAASRNLLSSLRTYLGGDRPRTRVVIADMSALSEFLNTRASHVAQTSLYGYLRTRAGTRYSELYENDDFLAAVNIAKWHVWVFCLSDLAVFAGVSIARSVDASSAEIRELIAAATADVLAEIGTPAESGDGFAESRAHLERRLAAVELATVGDDEAAFTESPEALVVWAPIVDDLKALDADIVRNSVRFRWQEVRRQLRGGIDAEAVLASYRRRA